MTNSIQKFQHQPPAAFGTNEEIAAIVERMERLLPIELSGDFGNNPVVKQNLTNAYVRAAQLSVFYRLIPGTDVHLIQFGMGFAVDIGVEAWKKAADRFCSHHHITFHAHYEQMTPEALKVRRGEQYTPDDVGYICYIWRSDKAQAYAIFGGDNLKDALTQGRGHWGKMARLNKKSNKWEPDQIPVQRTKDDVAKRRALKAALKAEFSLDSLLAAAPNEVSEALAYIDREAARASESPIVQRPTVELDEDGFVVTQARVQGSGRYQEPENDYIGDEHDEVVEDAPEYPDDQEYPYEQNEGEALAEAFDPEVVREYLETSKTLTGDAAILRDWGRKNHNESQGEAHLTPYRILVGEIDKLIGKGKHHHLLGVLLGREVHSSNRPGEKFVKLLLSFLQYERNYLGEDGKPIKNEKGHNVKEANPHYNEKFVLAIKEAWTQINANAPKPEPSNEPEPQGLQAEIPF